MILPCSSSLLAQREPGRNTPPFIHLVLAAPRSGSSQNFNPSLQCMILPCSSSLAQREPGRNTPFIHIFLAAPRSNSSQNFSPPNCLILPCLALAAPRSGSGQKNSFHISKFLASTRTGRPHKSAFFLNTLNTLHGHTLYSYTSTTY